MKFLKLVVAAIASIGLVAVSLTPATAAEPWKPARAQGTEQSTAIMESSSTPKVSYMSASKKASNGSRVAVFCTEYGVDECKPGSGWDVRAKITLGTCVANEVNCIESVNLYSDSQTPQAATFLRNVDGPKFSADSNIGLPAGSTTGIWQAKDLNHEGGNRNYAVWVTLQVFFDGGKVRFYNFAAGVAGVNEKADQNAKASTLEVVDDSVTGDKNVAIMNSSTDCLYTEAGVCGAAQTFSPNSRAGIKLRISDTLTGWLLGRLEKPTVSVSKYSAGINTVEIDGAPTLVAQHQSFFNESNFPEQYKTSGQLKFLWDRIQSKANPVMSHTIASSPEGIAVVEAVREKDADTASGTSTLWTVESLVDGQYSNRCLADKTRLVGLVTTNAMAFEGGAPSFKNGFLEYKVAGMHYLPDKSLAMGSYDLVMRSETARCLYGFGKAPISATVSVVNSNGTKTTATSVVSEKNGWLKLRAAGFTFSKKTIKVKITKKKK